MAFLRRNLLILPIFAAFFVMLPVRVEAASITVSPTDIDFEIRPGAQATVQFMATNAGEAPVSVEIGVENFRMRAGVSTPEFLPDQRDVGLAAWADHVRGPIILAPGEQKPIGITFTVPERTASGGAYGAAFLKAVDVTPSGSGAAIEPRVGVLLFGTVGDGAAAVPVLSGFRLQRDSSLSAPRSFSLSLSNQSATHVIPHGVVVVSDASGARTVSFPINNEGRRLMPGMMREYSPGWRDAGYGEAFGMTTLRPGYHHYEVRLAGGKGPLTTVASGDFLILPMKYLIGSGVVFLLLLFAVIRFLSVRRSPGMPPDVSSVSTIS